MSDRLSLFADECRDEAGHFVGFEIHQQDADDKLLWNFSIHHWAAHSGVCPGAVRRERLYPPEDEPQDQK